MNGMIDGEVWSAIFDADGEWFTIVYEGFSDRSQEKY